MPLEPGESAILTIRLALPLFLAAFGGLFAAVLITVFPSPLMLPVYELFVILDGFAAIVASYIYFDTFWLLTNLRVILRKQHALFWQETHECRLEQIQDCTTDKRGIIATIFDFGTLNLQTAGTIPLFTLLHVAQPERSREAILEQQRQKMDAPKPVVVVQPKPSAPAPTNLPV